MSGAMRDQMPVCAAFIDELRSVFGQQDIDNVIRRGLRSDCKPEHRVFFEEAGESLGTRQPAAVRSVSVADMVLGPLPTIQSGRKGRE